MSALDELIEMDEEWQKDWPLEDYEIVIKEAKKELAELTEENKLLKKTLEYRTLSDVVRSDYEQTIEELKEGIEETLQLAVECHSYTPEYFSIKWGLKEELDRLWKKWQPSP